MTLSQPVALDALFHELCRSDAPGLVVGVAQHGRTVYRRGFGLASVEHGVANTPWTRMRIGSTSKQFTCLAALLLAEDGALDVDAGVRRYLPELPIHDGPEPTLRQLMTHTSGYRCHLDLGFIAAGLAIQPPGTAWATLLRQREANFRPGTNMVYCNSGYHLLSRIIEQRSGMGFEDFLRRRIFLPLGMHDTESLRSDLELRSGCATLHLPTPGGGWRRGIFPSEELLGEGAMVSTVDDMLRWLAHLRAPTTLGRPATWAQLLAPAVLDTGMTSPYALGLMRHEYRGLEVIHHPGGVTGGASQALTVPAEGLDIIVIANGAPVSPRELAERIVDTMLGERLPQPRALQAEAKRFAPMLGTRYRGIDSGLVIGFAEAAGATLGLSLLNTPAVPLRDEGALLRLPFQDLAVGPFVLESAQLATGEGVAPPSIELREAGRHEVYELLPADPPALTEAGQALVGHYRSADLAADARLYFQSDALILQTAGTLGGSRLALEAFSRDVFGWRELDPAQPQARTGVLRVQRRAGGVTGLHLDTLRTRHLWFERVGDINPIPNSPKEFPHDAS